MELIRYMHLIFNSLFLIAGIKNGVTGGIGGSTIPRIPFFWFGDLLYNFLCHDYLMWEYKESVFGSYILPSHTYISLLIMFIAYPVSVIIYLEKFPKEIYKKVLWVLFWVCIVFANRIHKFTLFEFNFPS